MDIRTNEFEFTPKRCEEIDACIKVPCDPRGVISGRILDCCNKPIKNATLKLLEKTCKDELFPLTHTFTDENGFFLFGPLCPCTTYVIKIFVDEVKNRQINIDKCKCDRDIDCLEADRKCKYDDDYKGKDFHKEKDFYKEKECCKEMDFHKEKECCKEDHKEKECYCREEKWDWKKESRSRKNRHNEDECYDF